MTCATNVVRTVHLPEHPSSPSVFVRYVLLNLYFSVYICFVNHCLSFFLNTLEKYKKKAKK